MISGCVAGIHVQHYAVPHGPGLRQRKEHQLLPQPLAAPSGRNAYTIQKRPAGMLPQVDVKHAHGRAVQHGQISRALRVFHRCRHIVVHIRFTHIIFQKQAVGFRAVRVHTL